MTLDTLLIMVIAVGAAVILWRTLGVGDFITGLLPAKKLETLAQGRPAAAGAPLLPTHWPVNHQAIWADRISATARGLHKYLDLERYTFLLAPRMSDFLTVAPKVAGSQKAIAVDNHLRNNRVGCAFLEIDSGRPCGAFLFGSGQEFQIARGAFEATGFPFAVVEPTSQASIREGLRALGLLAVGDARASVEVAPPAELAKPTSASAKPAAEAAAEALAGDTSPTPRQTTSRSAPRKKVTKPRAAKSQGSGGRKPAGEKTASKPPASAGAPNPKPDRRPQPKGLFE